MLFLNIRVEVSGKENIPTHPFVVYGNHKSMMDPVILYYVYHTVISAAGKKTLEKVGFLRRLMRYMGAISIDRENDREAMKAMIDGIKTSLFGHLTRLPSLTTPFAKFFTPIKTSLLFTNFMWSHLSTFLAIFINLR